MMLCSIRLHVSLAVTMIATNNCFLFNKFLQFKPQISGSKLLSSSITASSVDQGFQRSLRWKLDKDIINVALPAFISLAADPFASFVDVMYVGRLGAVEQAGMGIAISAQYSVAKLYNDPLLKTSTSLVAGKSGDELCASVTAAISIAMIIGTAQSFAYLFCATPILNLMGVPTTSEMYKPALAYLKWRSLGVPAATALIVSNGIFRGRGDTKTPLFCTTLGNLVNILLDPILIFNCGMGCAGAGAATAVSQWVTAIPLLYLLNKSIPFRWEGREKGFLKDAIVSYFRAGGLIFLRTVAKISAYTVTAAAAARLGTIPMAAYSLTFNLGFVTSQLCEAFSIAAQALIARDMPLDTPIKKFSAAHIIRRALCLGLFVSGSLAIATHCNLDNVLMKMSSSSDVRSAAAAIMPIVLLTQLFKGLSYSTGGILLGGLDWEWTTASMSVASVVCVLLTHLLPSSLWSIWVALAAFMASQVLVSSGRIFSGRGPWAGLELVPKAPPTFNRQQNYQI